MVKADRIAHLVARVSGRPMGQTQGRWQERTQHGDQVDIVELGKTAVDERLPRRDRSFQIVPAEGHRHFLDRLGRQAEIEVGNAGKLSEKGSRQVREQLAEADQLLSREIPDDGAGAGDR